MSGTRAWDGILTDPLPGRTEKPREQGITFVSAKGLGLAGKRDLRHGVSHVTIESRQRAKGVGVFVEAGKV
jgi:hypothetical protein